MELKRYKNLPVYVVEDHNEALPHIYRSIGSRHLPLYNNSMVHFDSHPDMLLPRNMPADLVWDKFKLFENLDIENWILPACYAGHINRIYWIKCNWCRQIETGSHVIKIGKHKREGNIKVSTELYYFLSDALYADERDLTEVKHVTVNVVDFNDTTSLQVVSDSGHFVLDIDLDFFSTRNPFLNLYKNAELYERLKTLYCFKFDRGADLQSVADARYRQITRLEELFRHVAEHGDLSGVDSGDGDLIAPINDIIRDVRRFYPNDDVDWNIVHNAGMTCDETELPEHVSTREELLHMFEQFQLLISSLPKPTLVTVARSSEDDYCPVEDVDFIQEHVLNVLKRVFVQVDLNLMYEEDVDG